MRPVEKGPWPTTLADPLVQKTYSPYGTAKDDLIAALGEYCSFCEWEQPYSSLAVEHVQAKKYIDPSGTAIYAHLAENWDNFLLACRHCNSIKGDQNVVLPGSYLPHLINTWHCFDYKQGGLVSLNTNLSPQELAEATTLLELVGLDRRPGRPNYSTKDRRWQRRRTAWELAERFLIKYEAGKTDIETVCELAICHGFWSVWMTVFATHLPVQLALVNAFKGTFVQYAVPGLTR